MKTENFNFFLLSQNQSQKEATINENLKSLDSLLNRYIRSIRLSSPPEENIEHLYIVGANASNEWEGKENNIVYYHQKTWKFIKPKMGMLFFIYDEKAFYGFNGIKWEKFT